MRLTGCFPADPSPGPDRLTCQRTTFGTLLLESTNLICYRRGASKTRHLVCVTACSNPSAEFDQIYLRLGYNKCSTSGQKEDCFPASSQTIALISREIGWNLILAVSLQQERFSDADTEITSDQKLVCAVSHAGQPARKIDVWLSAKSARISNITLGVLGGKEEGVSWEF